MSLEVILLLEYGCFYFMEDVNQQIKNIPPVGVNFIYYGEAENKYEPESEVDFFTLQSKE